MHDASDMDLLRQYAVGNSDAAFAALVSRHINLVYSAAVRKTGNPHAAEEITQAVFIILARKAGRILDKTILPGWLYQTTRLTASSFLRRETRRTRREQEAFMQSESHTITPDPTWEQLAPLLEDAMGRLGDKDRAAVVLRFFGGKSFAEVAMAAGVSENAAKKRVGYALEKLHRYFSKRGVSSTTEIIAGAISANSVQAAPVALAKAVTAVAVAKGAAASTSTLTLIKGALKIMAWTKAKTAVVAVVAVIAATGTTTVVIKSGVLGHSNAGQSSETMARAGASPRIFSNGINNAHNIPDAIFTYPDGDETTHRYLEGILKQFAKNMGPGRTIKSDRELTEEDIQSRTIYIYGSPENHSLFRRVRDQLPIRFEDDGVVVGKKKFMGHDVGAIFTCPNPLSPEHQLVIYGTVSPEALKNMNDVFHGPTDYVIFNDTTRQFSGVNDADRFLLLGSFDKSDLAHWRVDEKLQLLPPKALQRATAGVVVAN
jgi:RNA polymerase sigma factor (sigma-70 family)